MEDHKISRLMTVQVLTVHSPIRLENHTSHPLSFVLHLASTGDGLKHAPDPAESRIPCHAPLAPGSQCYLPLTAMRCAIYHEHFCNTLGSRNPQCMLADMFVGSGIP